MCGGQHDQSLLDSRSAFDLAVCVPSSLAWAEEGQINSCEILADWDQQWDFSGDGGSGVSLVHRYRVVFDPPLSDSISHEELNTSVEHTRGSFQSSGQNTSIFAAGGEIEIILEEQPQFGDYVWISVQSPVASCSRSPEYYKFGTNQSQIMRSQEKQIGHFQEWRGIVRESLSRAGDGKRELGGVLESNELGNGTLVLDMANGSQGAAIDLDLDRIWLNETYHGTELISQDFEMAGSGLIAISIDEGKEGAMVNAEIKDAYVLRSFKDGKITERMMFEGDGWISIDGGDNESSGGVFGEVFLLYFETWDEDGFRRLQDIQIEANASARISAAGEFFSFDLEELILREKWEEGIRTDQYSRIFGSGQFEFIASDEAPYIEVNGTIPIFHMQSEGGETVADTIIVDGTYDGDAEGSFGLVRRIVESDVYGNATGTLFEADKIQNEFWFNVSATPFGPMIRSGELSTTLPMSM
ncbi:MAG: hypothetical protein Ct9H90mP26_2640 [Methanobacteriota archaeon]|nr:MAG: hypothetical protein Ct9H90mP26_2640 [Euryarchaeota archaeon]